MYRCCRRTIMRLALLAVLAVCSQVSAFAQGPGPDGGPGGGAGGGATGFALIFCNKSKDPVAFVAIGSRVVGANDSTRFQGWWQVSQGQCLQVGTVPAPGFTFYARSSSGIVWSGKPAFAGCVDFVDRFDVTLPTATEIKECAPNQKLVQFT